MIVPEQLPAFVFTDVDCVSGKTSVLYHPDSLPERAPLVTYLASEFTSLQISRFWGLIRLLQNLLDRLESDFGITSDGVIPKYMVENLAGFHLASGCPYPIVALRVRGGQPSFIEAASGTEDEWVRMQHVALGVVAHEFGHLFDHQGKLELVAPAEHRQGAEFANFVVSSMLDSKGMIASLVAALKQDTHAAAGLYPDLPSYYDNPLEAESELHRRCELLSALTHHWLKDSAVLKKEFLESGDLVTDAFCIRYMPDEVNRAYFNYYWTTKWGVYDKNERVNPISGMHHWASLRAEANARGLSDIVAIIEALVSGFYEEYPSVCLPLKVYYEAVRDYFDSVYTNINIPNSVSRLSLAELSR